MSRTLIPVLNTSGEEGLVVAAIPFLRDANLALSNVEINSLFIDEGFGTLNPQTLDQTLDILEKLQSES